MSVKYRLDFTDKQGVNNWSIRIVDTNYQSYSDRVISDGGTVQSIGCLPLEITELVEYKRFQSDGEGFVLSYGDRGDDPHKSIKGSTLEFTFNAQNQDDLAFIEEIAQTQEQTYFIDLYKGGSLFWRGGVLQDLIRIPYTYFPIQVRMQATCGLARLKGIAKEINKYDNILSSIAVILRELDNGNLWADSDNFIRTSVRWFENQMVIADGLDSLAYSRLFRLSTEYDLDDQGNKDFRDWYEWLEKVLDTFGARIFMAEGVWQIVQIDEIANNPSKYNLYTRNYVYNATGPGPSSATGIASTGIAWTTYFELQTSGSLNRLKRDSLSYTYLPAVKEIKVNWNAPYAQNQLIGIERINSSATALTTQIGSVQYLTSSDPNFRNQVYIFVKNQWFKVINSSVNPQTFYLRQYLQVRIIGTSSTYYLQPSSNGFVWTTYNNFFQGRTSYYIENIAGSSPLLVSLDNFSMFTDNIPIDGNLEISMFAVCLNSSFLTHLNVAPTPLSVLDGTAYNSRGALFSVYYRNSANQLPINGG